MEEICLKIPKSGASELFLISDFPAEMVKANKNYQKASHILQYNFAQKTSLILQASAHLSLKIICSRNTARSISGFTNFPVNMFLFGVRKDICTAAFDAQELHFWSTLKANVCILLYISVRKFLLVRFYLVGGGIGEEVGLNNFLKAALYSGLAKRFALFRFNWNFWKFNYFSAFGYFYTASSRPLLSATIAPNLVPWVLEKIFSLEMTKNYICLGGASKQIPFFQKMCPEKTHPWPQCLA